MSRKNIDENVVSLEFDNKNFEENVKTSMTTLEKFKSLLKFEGATKGLDEIEKAAKKCDISSMDGQVKSLTDRFRALDVAANAAIYNITNRLVDMGVQLVKTMSGVDLVKSGWSKMNELTGSVQTLVNTTGFGVDEITRYLGKLMTFSDETSFGFNDMTSALSTMVASGGDIEKLIPMIEGIANATAYAGKGAAEFQRVIYNLNQSYSGGYLQRQDWNSVALAGVNSKALMEILIETGEQLDKIKKGSVTVGNFADSLKNKWADTEVMEVAFNRFAAVTEAAQELVAEGKFDTFSKAYKYLESLEGAYEDIAIKAAKSAQEAKTFREAIDSVVDAASSKWMQVFNNIFGNYEQQKVTWTNLANDLYDIFVQPIDDLASNIIAPAFTNQWDEFTELIESTGTSMDYFEKSFSSFARRNGYAIDNLLNEYGSLKNLLSSGTFKPKFLNEFLASLGDTNEAISSTKVDIESLQSLVDKIWRGDYGNGEARYNNLVDLGYDYYAIQKLVNISAKNWSNGYKLTAEALEELSEEELRNLGYTEAQAEALKNLGSAAEESGMDLQQLIENITRPTGQQLLSESISDLTTIILNLKTVVGRAWSNVFSREPANAVYYLVSGIHDFTQTLASLTNITEESSEGLTWLETILTSIFSILKPIGNIIGIISRVVSQFIRGSLSVIHKILGNLNIDITKITEVVNNALIGIKQWISESDIIYDTLGKIGDKISEIISIVQRWIDTFANLESVKKIFADIKNTIVSFGSNFDLKSSIFGFGDGLKETVSKLKSGELKPLEFVLGSMQSLFNNLSSTVTKTRDTLSGSISDFQKKYKEAEPTILAITDKIRSFIETMIGLGAGYMIIKGLTNLASAFSSLLKPITAFSDMLGAWKNAGTSISGYFNALTKSIKVNNILKVAAGIGILAGSLYLLSRIGKDSAALWETIGATVALAAVIVGFAWAMGKVSQIGAESKDFSINLAALAGSLFVLALSLKSMDKLQNGGTSVALLGLMLTGLVVAAKILSQNAKIIMGVKNGAKYLLQFAASMYILALAIKKIDSLEIEHFWETLILFAACVTALVAISYTVKGIDKNQKTAVLSLSLSLLLMASAFEKFGKLDGEKYFKGIMTMLPVIGAIILVLNAVKKTEGLTSSIGVFVVSVATSVLLLSKGIEKLGKLDKNTLLKGGIAVATLFTVVGFIAAAISGMSKSFGTLKQAGGMALTILALSASLYLMAGVVMIFKNMDEKDLNKAVGAIAALEFFFGLMIGMMQWTKFDAASVNALGKIAIIIGVLAASVFALSFIKTEKLVYVIGGISALLLLLAGLMLSMSKLSSLTSCKIVESSLMMVVILGAISGAIYLLSKFTDADKALKVAEAISLVMAALSVSFLLIAGTGTLVAGAMTALGPMVATLGAVVGVIVAIGAVLTALIENNLMSISALDTFTEVLTKLGAAIGGFLGGIIGGFIGGGLESATSVLPSVGESLALFAESIQTFLAIEIPEGFISNIKDLASAISSIADKELTKNLKEISKDKSFVKDLQTFFEKFGTAIVAFSDTISGKINSSAINAASNAGMMMVELNNSIPTSGGLFKIFTGSKDLGQFSADIIVYANALVSLCEIIGRSRFDMSVVEKAKDAGMMMTELANSIPSSGGLWQLFGEQNLQNFGDGISSYASGLVDLCNTMSSTSFSQDLVEKAKNAGLMMVELSNAIPESASVKSILFGGEKSLSNFGTNISNFAGGLSTFSAIMAEADLDNETVESAANAGFILADLANAIPENGAWFTGTQDLGNFGDQLNIFGTGLKDFCNTIAEIVAYPTDEIRSSIVNLSNDIIDICERIADATELKKKLQYFGAGLIDFGTGLKTFIYSVSGIEKETADNTISLLENVVGTDTISEAMASKNEIVDMTKDRILGGIETGISDQSSKQTIFDSTNDTTDKIIDILDIQDETKEAGINALLGIYDGLSDVKTLGLIENQVSNVTSNYILGPITRILEEHSPSKAAQRIGSFFLKGLAIGMEDTQDLKESTENTGFSLMKMLSDSLNLANSILDDDLNPVITPVLDLSNIRENAGQISGLLGSASYDSALAIGAPGYYNPINQNGGNPISIEMNNTFEMGNVTNLDRATAERFADMMYDRINIRLGQEIM